MSLPFDPPLEPMLARAAPDIPREGAWLYEPKWDGFRAIVFRDGPNVHIASRNALALERYFPELIEPLKAALPERSIVDGEVVIATEHGLDFDALQQRIHPAASRVRMLSEKTPASVVLFDLLGLDYDDLRERPLTERRTGLMQAAASSPIVGVTPQTADPDEATTWFTRYEGAGLDGVVAKDPAGTYRPGERRWVKVKHLRTADCVVGGYRLAKDGKGIGSLLLGLYDTTVRCITSATPRHSTPRSAARSSSSSSRWWAVTALVTGERRAVRAAGSAPPTAPGPRCGRIWSAKCRSTTCRAAASATRPDSSAGARTRLQPCDFDQLSPPEEFSLDDILVTRGD